MFQISIDTGGTFTDGILLREDGTVSIAKAESTPDDLSQGIIDCVKLLAQGENGMPVEGMLAKTSTVTIGSTAATNAVLQLKGAKVGMITTKGFRDVLEFRRIIKEDLFNLKLPKPTILVPRYLRLGVEERVRHTGEVITPLNEDEVCQAVRKLKAHNCEVIAVCFFHSYANPEHERKAAEVIRAEYPEAEVVLSSSILPQPMEFERFNTTVLAAYITPLCSAFLRKLDHRLKEADFKGVLLHMTCNAGVTTAEVATERPILMLSSGPSAGPLLASVAGKEAGFENILFSDMGGTSYDISVLPKGRILTRTDGIVGDQRNAIETVDVLSVGAGGGTIAYLDLRGVLRVGPESAGADPGPACYGKGGQRPTVTDADVVLGYIPADYFLGGEVKLDLDLAQKAIKEQIGDPLGLNIVEAAYAIRSIVDATMAEETFLAVTDRGYDPSDFVICSGGGAGPTHVFDLAKRLHIKEVYIPKVASVFCAYGMTCADFKHEVSQFASYTADKVDLNELSHIYQRMEREQGALLEREGVAREAIKIRRGAKMQYFGQIYGVDAWLPEIGINGPVTMEDLEALIEAFHKRHEEKYGHADRTMPSAFASIRLEAIGTRPKVGMAEQPGVDEEPSGALKRRRRAYFKELAGFVETPCYDGDQLRHGNVITGPAIVEEKTTTLVIPPKAKVTVDRYGNYYGQLEYIPPTKEAITIGSVLVSIIERRLSSICQETGLRAVEGSYSICTSQLGDLGAALFDGKERLVTHGEWLEIHVTGAHIALKGMLDYIGRDNIHPGDFIVGNDPYIVRCGHLPDWSFVRPVFYQGEPMFYLYFRSHQHDSGGAQMACYTPRAFDIHGEGVIIPPTKVIERGKVNEDAYAIILKNVRDPAMVRMDNMMVNAAMMKAEERLIELCQEYGKDVVKAAIDESIRSTEKVVRDEISKWPAGEYRSQTAGDSDGTTPDPVWVSLKLTIKPEVGELVLDFSDNPRQVDFINCPLGQVWASVAIPLRWTLPPGLPRNHALYNCVTIITKRGTVFDPVYPATCGSQAPSLGHQIIELVQLALCQAIPTKVPAGWTRDGGTVLAAKYLTEIDPRTGAPKYYWFATFHEKGSMGGIWGYDGWDALGSAAGGGGVMRANLEPLERAYPWRWLGSEWLTDSAGNGQFRGGMGAWTEVLSEHPIDEYRPGSIMYMSGAANGEKLPPFGLLGGTDGLKRRAWIQRKGKLMKLRTLDIVPGEPGDVVIHKVSGGGGVGHPLDREVDKVREDALNEYISVKTAREVYGVVIDPETFEVDYKATTKLRNAKKRAKSYRERFVPPS